MTIEEEETASNDGATGVSTPKTMMSGIISEGGSAIPTSSNNANGQSKQSNGSSKNSDATASEEDVTEVEGVNVVVGKRNHLSKAKSSKSKRQLKSQKSTKALTPTSKLKRSVDRMKRSSSSAYEESFFCCPIRFIGNFPIEWPRTTAIVFGVVIPLWLLIFFSAGFGYLLAEFEHENEILQNDYILANRTVLDNVTNVEELFYRTLPETCFNEYFFVKNKRPFNNNGNSSSVLVDVNQLLRHVQNCSDTYGRQGIQYASEIWRNATSEGTAFESLSFNWNRCWPEELRGGDWNGFVFYPNRELVNASRPSSQAATYEEYWHADQQQLYQQFLEELPSNATSDEKFQHAFLPSVQQATGSGGCILNTGGTAWFFFTVMTTVGYGNQAPETENGRMLIYTAGMVSLVLFGAILAGSGFILTAIFDDMVSRFTWTKFLNNPWVGLVLWGTVWLAFALVIASDAGLWWENRLGDGVDQFDFTRGDSIWFAYISTSTVGLGDFYFQPEVMFGSDAMKFSILFLTGFVFLANFLSKIKESIESLLPKKKKYTLEGRLARTRMLACWNRGTGWKLFRRSMGEEIEPATLEEKLEKEELKDDAKTLKPKILQERIEELKTFLTEEQQDKLEESESEEDEMEEDDEEEGAEEEEEEEVGAVEAAANAVAGLFGAGDDDELSEEELALKLVQEEEAILRDLLVLVQEKHQRLLLQSQQDSENVAADGGNDADADPLSLMEKSTAGQGGTPSNNNNDDEIEPSVTFQQSEEQDA